MKLARNGFRSGFSAFVSAAAALLLGLTVSGCKCSSQAPDTDVLEEEEAAGCIPPIGFRTQDYVMSSSELRSGEIFGSMMGRMGCDPARSVSLAAKCDTIFNLRKLRAGNRVDAFYPDSAAAEAHKGPAYIVYQESRTTSIVFDCGDSLAVWRYEKPIQTELLACDVTINSSLWEDMRKSGVSPLLILQISDIYAWTVDFFGLQEGDRFRVAYRQSSCEGEVINVDKVEYAVFSSNGNDYPAIWFDQGNGGNCWWNEKGESLRKAFLKAPLKFNRISSGFSYARKHPISGKVRPHTAVDYAAPSGTPVHSIGDGTVISAGWAGGGGNTVKIRHNSVYTTSYMHLSRYGEGIKAGKRVRQGEVIGYVGSTGSSTGPHLDFRVYKNGSAINPLKLESPPEEPICKENLPALDSVWTRSAALLDSLLALRQ